MNASLSDSFLPSGAVDAVLGRYTSDGSNDRSCMAGFDGPSGSAASPSQEPAAASRATTRPRSLSRSKQLTSALRREVAAVFREGVARNARSGVAGIAAERGRDAEPAAAEAVAGLGHRTVTLSAREVMRARGETGEKSREPAP